MTERRIATHLVSNCLRLIKFRLHRDRTPELPHLSALIDTYLRERYIFIKEGKLAVLLINIPQMAGFQDALKKIRSQNHDLTGYEILIIDLTERTETADQNVSIHMSTYYPEVKQNYYVCDGHVVFFDLPARDEFPEITEMTAADMDRLKMINITGSNITTMALTDAAIIWYGFTKPGTVIQIKSNSPSALYRVQYKKLAG